MDDLSKTKIVLIGGPTATGKTALSVALSKQFDAEIISADSMQIYRGLTVGTAKARPEEMQGIPHHLLDFLEPDVPFSVADYVKAAATEIQGIAGRGKLPIVVGGTGLYLSSLVNGVRFTEQKTSPEVRSRLEKEALELGAERMHLRLEEIDPEAAAAIHANNLGRVIRALELYECTGKTITEQKKGSLPPEKPYESLCFCLADSNRETLYQRIDSRVDNMMQEGILPEAKYVFENRERFRTAAQAIGYKEFFPYFEGTASLAECVQKLKQASRNYAKRQLTWFRHMENVSWLEAGNPENLQCAAKQMEQFLF